MTNRHNEEEEFGEGLDPNEFDMDNPPAGPEIYEELAMRHTTAPRTDVEEAAEVAGPPGNGEHMSLSEQMDLTADMSDVQTGMFKLMPPGLGDKTQNNLMIGRLPPESEMPMIKILATDSLMRSDPEDDVDFNGMLVEKVILLSIGREGMGRIDVAELIGAARDRKDAMERLRYGE